MQYYAVIDTNVLVSAMIRPESIPGSVVTLAFSGPIIPVLDQTIENEYRAVLSRPKFHLTNGIIDAVIDTFRSRGRYRRPRYP